MIGIEVLKILKNIHNVGIIHRDIKPANICYGSFFNNSNKFNKEIVLIDFGLGKKFANKHLRPKDKEKKRGFVGSLLFTSSSALCEYELGPKDDVESLFYVLTYLKNGNLSWSKIKHSSDEDLMKNIFEIHNNISPEELFKGLPKEVRFLFKTLKNFSSKGNT